jgi:hypothetical protein
MKKKYRVGDIITLEGTGYFYHGVDVVILELDEDGEIQLARAVVPDERLGRAGFIEEGGEYYIVQWEWSLN